MAFRIGLKFKILWSKPVFCEKVLGKQRNLEIEKKVEKMFFRVLDGQTPEKIVVFKSLKKEVF